MRPAILLAGAALVLTSAWAVAQEGPESLLPCIDPIATFP